MFIRDGNILVCKQINKSIGYVRVCMHTNACVMCVYTQFPHGGKLFGVKMNVSQQEGSVGFHKVQNGHNDVWESKLCETQAKIFRHTLLRL